MRSFVKVFLVLFVPICVALVLTFYFTHSMMLANARRELLQEMKNKWVILAQQSRDLETLSRQSHEHLAEMTRQTSLRVTVVDDSGRVLTDSSVPYEQIPKMENHKGRPEIKAAIYSGDGFSTRYSATTRMEMLYYARRLSDDRVLRLAYPATYVKSLQQRFTEQVIWAFVCLGGVVFLLALYLARRVSLPVQKLNYIADSIEAGKTHIHFPRFRDPSMAKIAGLIYRIYSGMQKKNFELARDREKLHHIFTSMDQGVLLLDNEDTILHTNHWLENEFGIRFIVDSSLYNTTNDIHLITFFREILNQTNDSFRLSLGTNIYDINFKQIEDQKLLLIRNVTQQVEYESFKEELTGNISHELKTPLSLIMGYAETLRDNPEIEEAMRQRFLDHIYTSSVRLNNLINDIIELHRLESVGNSFSLEAPISLSDIETDIGSLYVDREDGKELILEVDQGTAGILAEHLQSILINLIDNAFKYSEGPRVIARVQRKGQSLVIQVDDQGPLIESADKERIFERFYTCSKSRNKQHSGTGLGLSIVKHITNLYGGTICVEENSSGGNRFKVCLHEKSHQSS